MSENVKKNKQSKASAKQGAGAFFNKGLRPKIALFVKEYLVDLNGTQAAIRAGYSAKTANEQAARMLAKDSIKKAVQEAMRERSEKVAISAEDVLQSILSIRGKAVEAEKYNDALKANELLGRHLKLFTDKTELSGGLDINRIERRVIDGDTSN